MGQTKIKKRQVLKSDNRVDISLDKFSYCFHLNDGIDSIVKIFIDEENSFDFFACLTHHIDFYPECPKIMSLILFYLPDTPYIIDIELIDYIINNIVNKFVEIRQGISDIGKFLNIYEHVQDYIPPINNYHKKIDELATKFNNVENFEGFIIRGICFDCSRKIKSTISYDRRNLREIIFSRCEICGIYSSIVYYFETEYELMDYYESDIKGGTLKL